MTSSFISNAEQQARIDLAACYRLVDLYGMSDMILNHITVRVPGDDDHFLINPFGLMYHEITAASLIKVALDLDEHQRLVDDLGDNDVMILRNHGLLTVGVTVAEAFVNMLRLERACQTQLLTMSAGASLRMPLQPIIDKTFQQLRRQPSPDKNGRFPPHGEREWPALLRLLDLRDPSYKD